MASFHSSSRRIPGEIRGFKCPFPVQVFISNVKSVEDWSTLPVVLTYCDSLFFMTCIKCEAFKAMCQRYRITPARRGTGKIIQSAFFDGQNDERVEMK
ncbi:hypothetical protein BTVI_65109 [Pitangus sulphuratus]|nr:hypothetical protein BTVI_65109 [Pitangus sulphuratus]